MTIAERDPYPIFIVSSEKVAESIAILFLEDLKLDRPCSTSTISIVA
jgi:hypothetical protein